MNALNTINSITIPTDKKELLEFINEYPNLLSKVSQEMKDDYDIVIAAVKSDGTALQYASERLKNDLDIIDSAFESNPWAYEWFPESMKQDPDVGLNVVKHVPGCYMLLNEDLKHNRDIIIAGLQRNTNMFTQLPEMLKNDKSLALLLLETSRTSSMIFSLGKELKEEITELGFELNLEATIKYLNNCVLKEKIENKIDNIKVRKEITQKTKL